MYILSLFAMTSNGEICRILSKRRHQETACITSYIRENPQVLSSSPMQSAKEIRRGIKNGVMDWYNY